MPNPPPSTPTNCYSLACVECGVVVQAITEGAVKSATCWRCGKHMAVIREISVFWNENGATVRIVRGDP